MRHVLRLLAAAALSSALLVPAADAQVNMQPTPAPTVTAENEAWYQSGEPLMFAGNLYYPAGPAIHFIANEMVRSAVYRGIPVYSRTTIEPYSVVFVPVAGGMMQPYERPRTGDIAGTSGSSVTALPVDIASSTTGSDVPMLQAPAPPIVGSATPAELSPESVAGRATRGDFQASVPEVGTSGRVESSRPLPVRPQAANGIFVEFNDRRWFSSGPPVARGSLSLKQIGDYHGFPVYAAGQAGNSTIYIPVAKGVEALAPFSARRK